MAAGIGSMNWYYQRYSDTAGIITGQPGFTTSSWVDPGWGWDKFRYQNQNGQYVRHDENNNPTGIPSSYVRHDENNNPVGVISSYLRHDSDNVGYATEGGDIPNFDP